MSETPRTDRMVASWPLESFGEMTGLARQLERENADALEENARLKAAWDASHKQAMKNGAACNEWRDRAERAEAELAETRRDLQFIERWANHHGQKPNITPREVLSMIQHYPPILEITRSYEDGRVPDTPNPWAELAKLRAEANDDDALRERMADILTRTAAALKGEPEPLTLHDWSGLPEIAELALTAERERADRNQEDAERWNLLCELWHASTELSLMQEEDGRWSIKQVEDIDGEMFYQLWGDTPDAAIDAARRK